jgi:hypothetical protein
VSPDLARESALTINEAHLHIFRTPAAFIQSFFDCAVVIAKFVASFADFDIGKIRRPDRCPLTKCLDELNIDRATIMSS